MPFPRSTPDGGLAEPDSTIVTPINQHKRTGDPDRVRLLHVDDERDFLELAAAYVERLDDRFSVVTETSVDSALDRLSEASVDCVISDYQMPGRDGLDFLDAVRADHPDLPFILFTGRGSEEIASDAIARGVTDYLQKGGGTDQYEVLVNRVRNAVEARRTNRELMTTLSWYQRLVEQNLAGIYLIQEGKLVFVNQRLADIFGYTQAELIGESPTELIAPADRDLVKENVRRREVGEVNSIQYALEGERKDGSRVDIEVHGGVIEFAGEPAVMGLLLERRAED